MNIAMLRIAIICFVTLTALACGSGSGGGSGGGAGGGGGGIGIDFPSGGAIIGGDTPVVGLPPNGFPDGGFTGDPSSVIALDVAGRTSTGGLRGTSDFTVGVTEGISEIRATITKANAVQFVAQSGGAVLAGALLDTAGDPLVELMAPTFGPQQTAAVFADRSINSLPYPTSFLDSAIVSGSEYRYQILSTAAGQNGISGTVVAKNDPFLAGGTLRVRVYIVGTLAQSSENRTAISQAIEIWREIYDAAGINLDVTLEDLVSGTGILPSPNVGSAIYAANAATARPYTLNLYVGAGISQTSGTSPGDTFPNEVLGIAASIPGPSIPTIKSAVALSLVGHYGPDGIFSSSEVEIFGSTMAHEAGHYLGLFHTVEFAGESDDSYIPGDLFPDTVPCFTTQECINTGASANLMFPAVIAGQPTQRDLSLNQRGALNLQVLVD
jgi:hypothetical protein